MIPRISASNVAALIGKNPWKKPHQAMYQYLALNHASQINEIKSRLGRKTLDDLAMEAIQKNSDIAKQVHRGLEESLAHASQVVNIVDSTAHLIEGKLEGPYKAEVAAALASTIQSDRGTRNENNVLDLYETETGKPVTERNTMTRTKEFSSPQPWKLVGRIDGLCGNRILDAKERKRKWANVPEYDVIQLRAQMELQDLPEAELVERFPDGTRRNTILVRSETEWQLIRQALDQSVRNIYTLIEDPDLLQALVEECTLPEVASD